MSAIKLASKSGIAASLALLTVLITWMWSGSWHAGLGKWDFPGHVALIASLAEQLAEHPGLPLWTADWNAGASLVFWYIQPLISSFLLLPFVSQWGLVDGIRMGDTVFLVLAGFSMFAWGRHLTRSTASALLGAVFYSLHPTVFSFVGTVGHIHQPVSMAIIPLLFLAWARLGQSPTAQNGIYAVVASALLFYDMERFWLILPHALAVYFCVVLADSAAGGRRAAVRRALWVGVAAGCGMSLLVAFPTLPGVFERPLLQWHDLRSIDVFRQYYSFPHLLALVDRGGTLASGLAPHITQEFVSLPGQWYQGLVALGFVGVGSLLLHRNGDDLKIRAQLSIALFLLFSALLIAFGVHAVGPKHWRLFGGLLDKELSTALVAQLLSFSLLTLGFLMAALRLFYTTSISLTQGSARRWLLGWGLVVIAFLLAKPFVLLANSVFIYSHLRAPSHFAFPALPFLLATATCLVAPAWIRLVGAHRATGLVAAVVLLHLVDVWPYRFQSEWSYPDNVVEEWNTAYQQLDDAPAGRMLDTHHYSPVADMLITTQAKRDAAWSWLSWTSTRYVGDIVKTGFFDSMRIARARPDVAETNTRLAAELSALANVRFVSRVAGISPEMPANDSFQRLAGSDRVELYENKLALPYVQFYPQVALLSGTMGETVPLIGALAQRGVATVTLDDDDTAPDFRYSYWQGGGAKALAPPDAQPLTTAAARQESADHVGATPPCAAPKHTPTSITLQCEFERAGTLVIAEAWFPNWHVTLNGKSQPASRVNHAFQGVAVNAGEADVLFEYRAPIATRVALAISAVSWVVAIASLLFFGLRRVRAGDDAH